MEHVTYVGTADRVIPFPEERPDLVFTPEQNELEVPEDLAARLRKEPVRWQVGSQGPPQSTPPEATSGLAEAISKRTVDDVMEWVGDDVGRARKAYRSEMARDDSERRTTLIEQLRNVLQTTATSGSGDATKTTGPQQASGQPAEGQGEG